MNEIETVSVDDLPAALGCEEPIVFADEWRALPLRDWVIAADDVILRYRTAASCTGTSSRPTSAASKRQRRQQASVDDVV